VPKIEVVFYKEGDGSVPVLDWLNAVKRHEKRVYAKCLVRIAILEAEGHELRRPLCDYLRDGIYELRVRFGTVNYRILYFFSGQPVAILAHGLMKDDKVPEKDIELALMRKGRFEGDPEGHTYDED